MNELIQAAIQYREFGLSVIATDALKQSLVKWSNYQDKIAANNQLSYMFLSPAASCIAVVTGNVSGNLEAIDIDSKYDLQGSLLECLMDAVAHLDKDLAQRIVVAQTRSGGYHLYYRCQTIDRNQPLARRPATEAEKQNNPKDRIKVLIETRGEGGYIIVPPSPGYYFLQLDFSQIPDITTSQRMILFEAARRLNQLEVKQSVRQPLKQKVAEVLSPLDDYKQRGDIIGLLQKHEWIVVREAGKRTFLRRPGDTDKRSSGDYNHEMGLFSVFSTSTEFEPGRGYRPYAVYAVLECGGDFRKAVKRLAKEGYGYSSPERIKRSRFH